MDTHVQRDRIRADARRRPAPPAVDARARAAPITVVAASDRPAWQPAWRSRLACTPGIAVAEAPAGPGPCLASCAQRRRPTVLLLDKAWLDCLCPASVLALRQRGPHVRVLLVSDALCRSALADVLHHRFHGFLHASSPPELCVRAVRALARGELWLSRRLLGELYTDPSWPADRPPACDDCRRHAMDRLTPREWQVVARVQRGCSNKEIAHALGIQEDTVKKHLKNVFAKLGVHRRALVILQAPNA